MSEKIIVSIKPKYINLILRKEKVNEFRNFTTKRGIISYMYVYVTAPVSSLKYVLKINEPILFPDKVEEIGYGDFKFNQGESKYKVAYPIVEIFELDRPLDMDILNKKFNVKGPQAYAYLDTYLLLKEYLEKEAKYKKHT